MFLRQGSLENIKPVDPTTWNVRKASSLENEKFAFDKENYVYFRARIMTADVPNGNGDFFYKSHAWGGIKEAFSTMIGKPLDKDHDCDSVDKIKGKIVDVIPIETEKEYYLEGLIAADRRTDAEFCRKIENGEISSVSMSCLVEKARCALCGNLAHNPDELCSHMRPSTGCKGKKIAATEANPWGIIYEENFGINFTGLGAVTTPADPTARIFEVWADLRDSKKLDKLSLEQYDMLLKCATEISSILSVALGKTSQQFSANASSIESKEKKKVEVKHEENDSDENKKNDISKIVKVTEKDETIATEYPEIALAPVEQTIIGDGFSLIQSEKYKGLLELQDRENLTGIFVEQILENAGEADKVFRYQEKLGLIKPEIKKEVSRMDLKLSYIPGKTLENSFIVGSESNREYKVAVAEIAPMGIQNAILSQDAHVASPDEIIEQIKSKCSDLFAFKRYMRKKKMQVMNEKASLEAKKKEKEKEECTKKINDEKETKKNKAELIRQRIKSALRVKSQQIHEGFSMNQSEIEKPAKVNEALTIAVNEKEFETIKSPKMESSPVKTYFNRLPSSAPGEVQRALNPTEAKLKELQVKLATQEKELASAKEALDAEKIKGEKQEKGKLIYDIVATMKNKNMVASEKEDELISYLGQLANDKLKEFATVLNLSNKTADASMEDIVTEGNLAHVVETIEQNEDAVERLSQIMNKK